MRKRIEYFHSGVRLVWIVDRRSRSVAVYTLPVDVTVLDEEATLTGGDVLPGFECGVAELFSDLDSEPPVPRLPSRDGEPAWEAAYFFPEQGRWSEETFLQFHTNRMAELVAGRLEILPMPNLKHQRILRLLLNLVGKASSTGSVVAFAPLPTRIFPGTIREPDLLYIAPENAPGDDVDYPEHLDLVMEIVSKGDDAHKRDYEDKVRDYAKAGIAEYWIVDPQASKVTVLALDGDAYTQHGVFTVGQTASGRLLADLSVNVTAVMNA